MDDKPRNLKTMLSEAKDTSELMIDLGYAAVYFSDTAMAEEVYELESRLSELVHEMRAVCILAASIFSVVTFGDAPRSWFGESVSRATADGALARQQSLQVSVYEYYDESSCPT